jgi:DNA mismatch repair protein MutL
MYTFVNDRFLRDRMINRAVEEAFRGFLIPSRFPFAVLSITLDPSRIDANVHPAKAEVRFENEREIHHLVSSAIRSSLEDKTLSFRDKVESVYKSIFPGVGSSEAGEGGDSSGRSDWLFQESPQPLFESEAEQSQSRLSTGLYWQLHDSYILIQIRGGMVIIDQHAAHERILYDRARRNMKGEKPVVQSLLFPATLELSAEEYENFEKVADTLPDLGFEAEPFGMRTIIVRAIPGGVRNWDDGKLLRDILADLGEGLPAVDSILRLFACHSAIRAGDPLTFEEMESLTDQLFATEFPFTCPHGRPTMLRVELRELEKRFHRTPGSEG